MIIQIDLINFVDFKDLVWISATNDLTAVVQMHELLQYVVKSMVEGMRNKVYEQKLLKSWFWYRSAVVYEHLHHFFIESQKKCKKNALGVKIILNINQIMILLQNSLIIYIPQTLELICAKFVVS